MSLERLSDAVPLAIKALTMNSLLKVGIAVSFAVLFDISKGPELTALFILIIIDLLTALGAAKYKGDRIESRKMFRSAVKLLTYFGVVSAGFLLETSIGYNVGADEILIAFLASTEFISIMENMAKLGFKTPQRLLNLVEDVRDGRKRNR
jgi:phage-related holin